jgi:hypothetical protein
MKQSDPLQLVEQGSTIIATPVSALASITVMVLAALFIINYVVNIGFGKSFGRWPIYISIAVMLLVATMSWLAFGTPDHPMLGAVFWLWLVYFYIHLGVSFVLAAAIATPGCEMRAIPELLGRLTERTVAEHHCPASFITRIDAWERGRIAPPS